MKKVILYTIKVNGANPNGDPNNGNEPRVDSDGHGVISQFSIKHHIRNRFVDMGMDVYQMNAEDTTDNLTIMDKVNAVINDMGIKNENTDKKSGTDRVLVNSVNKALMDKYIDIGLFGATNAVVKTGFGNLSNVKPAVTFNESTSIDPISIERMRITHCITLHGEDKDDDKKSDSMGWHYYVNNATYVGHCVINSNRMKKNGVKDDSIDMLKKSICSMYDNDESAARPSGTIKVCNVYEIDIPDTSCLDVFDIEDVYRGIVANNGSIDVLKEKFEGLIVNRLK